MLAHLKMRKNDCNDDRLTILIHSNADDDVYHDDEDMMMKFRLNKVMVMMMMMKASR